MEPNAINDIERGEHFGDNVYHTHAQPSDRLACSPSITLPPNVGLDSREFWGQPILGILHSRACLLCAHPHCLRSIVCDKCWRPHCVQRAERKTQTEHVHAKVERTSTNVTSVKNISLSLSLCCRRQRRHDQCVGRGSVQFPESHHHLALFKLTANVFGQSI